MTEAEVWWPGLFLHCKKQEDKSRLKRFRSIPSILPKTKRVGKTLHPLFHSQEPRFAFQTKKSWEEGKQVKNWPAAWEMISPEARCQNHVPEERSLVGKLQKRERMGRGKRPDKWIAWYVHFFPNWQLIQVSLLKSTHTMLPSQINQQSQKQQGPEQKMQTTNWASLHFSWHPAN